MSRIPFAVSAIALALGVGGLLAAQPPKEPTRDGKTLSEWAKLLGDRDKTAHVKAATALRALAGQSDLVAEQVIASAADTDTANPGALIDVLIELGPAAVPALTHGLWSTDHRIRLLCLFALERIGHDGRPATASLVRLLSDPDEPIRVKAVEALVAVGAHRAVPALTRALDDKSSFMRHAAAEALIRLGANASGVVTVLLADLKADEPNIRSKAAWLLSLLGPEAEASVPALVAAIPGADPERTAHTALLLGEIGPGAKEAIPALKKKLTAEKNEAKLFGAAIAVAIWRIARDPDAAKLLREGLASTRDPGAVATALWRIDSGPETVAALTELLKSEKPEIAIAAAGALGSRSKDAVPLLGKMLANKEPNVRARAVVALNQLGPDAKGAVEPLQAALKDEVQQVALWAAVALCRIDPKADSIATLAGFLSDSDQQVRRDAIEALGLLGTNGQPAVAKLTLLLDDAEETARLAAAVALWRIEKHPLALTAMMRLLRSTSNGVRENALAELGVVFGPEAKPAVPDLVKRLFDSFSNVRSASAQALGRIGPAAKDAAPALFAVLESDEPGFVQSAACEALGLIQPTDKDAATAVLKKKLEHPDPLTRVHAALALWLIAGDKSGEKEAERGLGYRTYQVRITSAEALWRMKQDARAVPLLVRTLEESNLDGTQGENERYMAARALGRIGVAAKPAVPQLLKLIHHHDAALAATAADALKSIDPEAAKKAGVR